ncbi:hypothetical protein ACFOWM_10320 [Ferruginibacter yonginensis]|uniref:Uncharacterized protein n=1 Tax=Ferruginibacter yonginensis TaxID=1310416 RepID=A0ABV8QT38_9BACT
MKKIFQILFFIFFSNAVVAQINYNSKINISTISFFKKFENLLHSKEFTSPKYITKRMLTQFVFDGFSKDDSLFYSNIIKDYFDTSKIKMLPDLEKYNKVNRVAAIAESKLLTVLLITSLHNIVNCVDNRLLFVMPLKTYNEINLDESNYSTAIENTYVAGFYKNQFYFPYILIKMNELETSIINLNILIKFQKYSEIKESFFNTEMLPIIKICEREVL